MKLTIWENSSPCHSLSRECASHSSLRINYYYSSPAFHLFQHLIKRFLRCFLRSDLFKFHDSTNSARHGNLHEAFTVSSDWNPPYLVISITSAPHYWCISHSPDHLPCNAPCRCPGCHISLPVNRYYPDSVMTSILIFWWLFLFISWCVEQALHYIAKLLKKVVNINNTL